MSDLIERDRWTCRWCKTYRHPVATMVADHEARCEWREESE